ncbi:hypothetical protein HYS94_00055 [Candidatus Daviesbacteria bacterium]|nr:hypothetical protein [Candidatus Daviesbacteria bacterium]
MKLLLLHGAAIASSREKLQEVKSNFDENSVVVFEKEADIETIKSVLITPSLLGGEQLIVLENPPEDFNLDSSLITHHSSLLMWFDREVANSKPIMAWVKKLKGQVIYFPEGKEISVFPLLDSLAEGSSRAFLELDKLKKGGFEIQYFITMVFYLLRSLLATPKNAPQFIKDKLARQREKFSLAKIKSLYKDMLDLDFKIKSGLIDTDQAEFLLISKFVR